MTLLVISLILIGLLLIVLEIIFIPGTTVVGFLGFLFVVVGIYFSYTNYGNSIGTYVLVGTSVTSGLLFYFSFKAGLWQKFSLKTSIEGKVNEGITKELIIGEEGTTTSSLRPMGTAEFNGKHYEVSSNGEYIKEGVKIKILRIEGNNIIIEPTT